MWGTEAAVGWGTEAGRSPPTGRSSGTWKVTWVSVVSGWDSRSRRRTPEALPEGRAPGEAARQKDAGGQQSGEGATQVHWGG